MRNARCDFVSLSATQWYPILLGYCGAYLEGLGHAVKLIDAPAQGLDHETTKRMVRNYGPDLIVLYTGTQSLDNDLEFTGRLVTDLECDAVIVGPFASIDPCGTLAREKVIDKLIAGEFELAVAGLAAGKKTAEIRNLVFKENGRIIQNPPRPYLTGTDLDEMPFVSRFFHQQLDLYRYKTPSELFPFMDIMTGRGCAWGRCTYCLWVHTFIKGPVYATRSIENVIDEFRYIQTDLPQVRSVMLQDDTFTTERAMAFCEAKLKTNIKLPWSCYARANMPYEVLALMKQSGCRNLHVGYESADQDVLNRIKKGLTVERAEKFTRDAKRAGLRIHGDFALGFPGETLDAAQKTIDFAYRLNPHTAQFQIMIPFPGTPYFAEMKRNGWLNRDGQPDMPQFSNAQIRAMAKKAYRKFYISPKYIAKSLRHPHEYVLGRLKTISRAIPAILWKRWQV